MSFGTAGDVGTASGARMVRVIIPKAGTLHDIAIWCTVQSGNVEAAIYDDHATTRNRLYTTGSIACPAAGQWSILGDPGLSVVQGQHLDFWLACDNITAQFRQKSASTGQGHLPANFLPSPNGAVPQIVGRIPSATMPMPATLAETNIGEGSTAPLIIARVA